jgi:predicted ABC-type ATPase
VSWFARHAYGPKGRPRHNALSRAIFEDAAADRPWLVNVAGTVGSGKSTIIEGLAPSLGLGHGLVQLDRIMEAYPGYAKDLAALGPEKAFANWEAAAWTAGFDAIDRLTRKRGAIVLELSASQTAHVELLEAFSRNGYRTCMVVLTTPLTICEERARRRAAEGGRHVPPGYVASRHEKLSALLPRYRGAVDLFLESGETRPGAALAEAVGAFAGR